MKINFFAHCIVAAAMVLPLRGDVSSAMRRVGDALPNRALAQKEVQALLADTPEDSLLSQLIEATQRPADSLAEEGAIRLILAIEPFPFDNLAQRLAIEPESHRRTTLLWLLHRGATQDDQVAHVLELAKAELSNESEGTYPLRIASDDYRGATALRACDLAHNILITRMHPVGYEYHQIGMEDSFSMRNRCLDRLGRELELPVLEHAAIKVPNREREGVLRATLKKVNVLLQDENAPSRRAWLALLLALLVLIGGGWLWARR